MNEGATDAAQEINRLHGEAVKLAADSGRMLVAALAPAWQAGKLLLATKAHVRKTMGAGAWLLWLERHFTGTPRTAQRYMRLAGGVSDPGELEGMSLRQAYARLGIATEPKSRAESVPLASLPPHIRFAQRLLASLKAQGDFHQVPRGQRERYRQDLRALYEQLRALFEPAQSEQSRRT